MMGGGTRLTTASSTCFDILPCFGADGNDIFGGNPGDVLDFLGDVIRHGCRQVDFVDDGDDFQISFQRQVEIGQGLRLDALRGVDDQKRPFTA